MRRFSIFSALFLLFLLPWPLACSGGTDQPEARPADAPASEPVQGSLFTGKVVETMDAGGYTYVRLQNADQSVWAAARQTPVSVGDELTISTEMPMPDFHSETLDRTFDLVYFVGGFGTDPGAVPQAAMGASGADPHAGMDVHPAPSRSDAEIDYSGITVPEGGSTVADLWARKDELAGQTVRFRGRVVKFNGGILGHNWVHVRDGSGDEAAGTNDLTVTTDARCRVGDLVTVEGKVSLDKDFGAGYRYGLIVEDARVEVEPAPTEGR